MSREELQRRRKLLCVDGDLMLDLILGRAAIESAEIPKDANFSGAWYSHQCGSFDIQVTHSSFSEIVQGMESPRVWPIIRKL